MSSKEKVAIVTGATGALGKVVTKTLLEHGVYVFSTFREERKQNELLEFLGETRSMVTSIQIDVTNEPSVQALLQKAIEKHGRVDFLLNIVGTYRGGTEIANTKESDWDLMMNVNLKSAFLSCKAALPHMIRQNFGRIINISSRTAVEKRFRSKSGSYAVSKAGVVVLTETIADEVKKYDINVNCIMPSTIDTPDNRQNLPNADFSKWVKPEEIAKVILFLLADDSSIISGASIPVYGKA